MSIMEDADSKRLASAPRHWDCGRVMLPKQGVARGIVSTTETMDTIAEAGSGKADPGSAPDEIDLADHLERCLSNSGVRDVSLIYNFNHPS